MQYDFIQGEVILIDKPLQWTSHNVVKKIRGIIQRKLELKKIKVGHAGTLDPLATGLIILCTGKKTKEISNYQAHEKEYMATVKLGATTPSYDLETEIDKTFPVEHITEEILDKTLQEFTGDIQQVPPIFSAKRIEGERLYNKARRGETIDIKPVTVQISEMERISDFSEMPEVRLRVVCSKGTYIRSLAYDIGKKMGSGAYLAGLRRTRNGIFPVEDALSPEQFEKKINSI